MEYIRTIPRRIVFSPMPRTKCALVCSWRFGRTSDGFVITQLCCRGLYCFFFSFLGRHCCACTSRIHFQMHEIGLQICYIWSCVAKHIEYISYPEFVWIIAFFAYVDNLTLKKILSWWRKLIWVLALYFAEQIPSVVKQALTSTLVMLV